MMRGLQEHWDPQVAAAGMVVSRLAHLCLSFLFVKWKVIFPSRPDTLV